MLPTLGRLLYVWILRTFSRPLGRNEPWATIVEGFGQKTVSEEWDLIVQRDAYRAAWHKAMRNQGVDFILTVVHPLPVMPEGVIDLVIGSRLRILTMYVRWV